MLSLSVILLVWGRGVQTACHKNEYCKLRIIHPASPYFNKELEIEKVLTANGQKKVILKTSLCKKISVPLAWTNFYHNSEENKNFSNYYQSGPLGGFGMVKR